MAKLGQMVFGLTGKHFDSNLDTGGGLTGKHFDSNLDTEGKTQDSGYPPDRLNKRHNTDIWVLPPVSSNPTADAAFSTFLRIVVKI